MYGSGARIYIAVMPIENTSVTTLYIRKEVPAVLIAAAAGTVDRGACERLVAAPIPQMSGSTAWVSALPGRWIED